MIFLLDGMAAASMAARNEKEAVSAVSNDAILVCSACDSCLVITANVGCQISCWSGQGVDPTQGVVTDDFCYDRHNMLLTYNGLWPYRC
jgi:hypothetical protein